MPSVGVHTPEYKAKVDLEALRSGKTIIQIGQEFDARPVPVGPWKKAIQEQTKTLFQGKLLQQRDNSGDLAL